MKVDEMTAGDLFLDCPRCESAGSVYRWTCGVCESEPLGLPLHPSIPLRFTDVISELGSIARLASNADAVDGPTVAAACRRAASLLQVLRRQFVQDLVEPHGPPRSRPETFTPRSYWRPDRFTSAG